MTTDDKTGPISFRCVIGLHEWHDKSKFYPPHTLVYGRACARCTKEVWFW